MVTKEHIVALMDTPTIPGVKDLAGHAARAGQKQIAIDLYRCLVRDRSGQRVDATAIAAMALHFEEYEEALTASA